MQDDGCLRICRGLMFYDANGLLSEIKILLQEIRDISFPTACDRSRRIFLP